MSCYDPSVYNYTNLSEEDKVEIDFMIQIALSSMESAKDDYEFDLNNKNSTELDKIRAEERIKGIEEAEEMYMLSIVEVMVAYIDAYEYDVPQLDTDDYFFGYDLPIELSYD